MIFYKKIKFIKIEFNEFSLILLILINFKKHNLLLKLIFYNKIYSIIY